MSQDDDTDTDTTLTENRDMPPRARFERFQLRCRKQGDTRLDGLDFEKAEIERHLGEADRIFREQHLGAGTEVHARLFLEELERKNVIQKLAEAPAGEAAQPTSNPPGAPTMVLGGASSGPLPPPQPPPLPTPALGTQGGGAQPLPFPTHAKPEPPAGAPTTRGHAPVSPHGPAAPAPQEPGAEEENLAAKTRRLNAALWDLPPLTEFTNRELAREIREHRFTEKDDLPDDLEVWNAKAERLLDEGGRAEHRNPAPLAPAKPGVEEHELPKVMAQGLEPASRRQPIFAGAAQGATVPRRAPDFVDDEVDGPRTTQSPRPAEAGAQRFPALPPPASVETSGSRRPEPEAAGGRGCMVAFFVFVGATIAVIAALLWWHNNARQSDAEDEPPPIPLPIVRAAPTATPVNSEPSIRVVVPRPVPTTSAYHTPTDLPPKIVRGGRVICPDDAPKLSQILPEYRGRMVKADVATNMTVAKWPLSEDPTEDPTLWKEDYLFCKVRPPPKGSRRDVSACQVCRDDDGLPPRP